MTMLMYFLILYFSIYLQIIAKIEGVFEDVPIKQQSHFTETCFRLIEVVIFSSLAADWPTCLQNFSRVL